MHAQKRQPNAKNKKIKKGFKLRYSFLTLVLLCCLTHVGISAFYNISKTINYQGKIRTMAQLKEKATEENIRLKDEYENFNNTNALEAIARQKLIMAGEKEVVVIVSKKQEPQAVEEQKKTKKNIVFFKRKTPVKQLTGRKGN